MCRTPLPQVEGSASSIAAFHVTQGFLQKLFCFQFEGREHLLNIKEVSPAHPDQTNLRTMLLGPGTSAALDSAPSPPTFLMN